MTTTVKVFAHCAKDKHVVIKIGAGGLTGEHVIQDGEVFEDVVYDDKSISVYEEKKPE